MNLKVTGLLLLITFGCQQKHKNEDVVQLREQLPFIETPIKFNADIKVKYKTVELNDNVLIKKLNDRSVFSLLGKVFESENSITILGYIFDTIGTPILITFDNDGNEVSSYAIFETAKSELGYHTYNFVTILPNRQILFTDSTVTRYIDVDGVEDIERMDSILVTYKKYLVSETGLIELIN
jgi:hypothetical protein